MNEMKLNLFRNKVIFLASKAIVSYLDTPENSGDLFEDFLSNHPQGYPIIINNNDCCVDIVYLSDRNKVEVDDLGEFDFDIFINGEADDFILNFMKRYGVIKR